MISIISRANCEKVLAADFKDSKDKYVFEEFQVESLKGKVPGMMADYYSLTIRFKLDEEEQSKKYFIKKMTMYHKIQEIMGKQQGAYEKEDYIYNYLIPEFNKITNSSLDCAPDCYLALKNDLFVFQDMAQLGYKTILKNHDLAHCKAALAEIAKFHASSIIYEERQTKLTGKKFSLYDENPDIFKDSLFRLDKDYLGRAWFINCLDTLLKITKISTCASEEFVERLIIFSNDELYRCMRPSTQYRNIACHGDLALSNILFLETGDKITCKLIDFQALRYNPPAHDVMAYIYLVTSDSFRQKHREDLFVHYYDCLHKELAKHDIQIDFPYKEFRESTEYVRYAILFQTAFYATMMPLAEYPHIEKDQELYKKYVYEDRSAECLEQYKKDGRFAKLINEPIVELFYLLGRSKTGFND